MWAISRRLPDSIKLGVQFDIDNLAWRCAAWDDRWRVDWQLEEGDWVPLPVADAYARDVLWGFKNASDRAALDATPD